VAEPSPAPRVDRRRITQLTWVVLGLVPVLWTVEVWGPRWLNVGLRALWVVLAVGTVLAGAWVLVLRDRSGGRPSRRR
jgi:hypothetical protein